MADVEKFFFAGKDEAKLKIVEFQEPGCKQLSKEEEKELSEFSDPDEDYDMDNGRVLIAKKRNLEEPEFGTPINFH